MIKYKDNTKKSEKSFSEDYSALAESIKKELPALEKYIKDNFKLDCKLKFDFDKSRSRVDIYSDSLMREAKSDVDRLLFKDINVVLGGGDLRQENNTTYIWFKIMLHYEHPSGGFNGCDIVDGNIYYDVQDHQWLSRREADTKFRKN